MRAMRWLAVLAVVGVAAVIWMIPSDTAALTDGAPEKVVNFADTDSWVRDLHSGAEVVFRQEVTPGKKGAREQRFTGLGRLSAAEEVRLHDGFLISDEDQALAQAQTEAESGNPKDYQAFLRELYVHAKVMALHKMIEVGEYIVVQSNSSIPPIPHDYGVMAIPQFVLDDGSRRDVWFLIDFEKHPEVRSAIETAEEFESHKLDERVIAFNAQAIEKRQQLIQQHDEATQAVRNWSEERSASEAVAFRSQMLPIDFDIDRVSWMVSKRLRRNH